MYVRPFALIALLLAAARAEAQSPPATTDSAKHAAEGWIYGASLGIPGYRSTPAAELFTFGVNFTQLRPGRLGADFSLGTIPSVAVAGILPLGARAGVAFPLAAGPYLLVLPSAGVSTIMAMGPEGGAGVGGVTAGIATIAHAGPLGLRTGITWHGFANTSGAIWLLEIGFVSVPSATP